MAYSNIQTNHASCKQDIGLTDSIILDDVPSKYYSIYAICSLSIDWANSVNVSYIPMPEGRVSINLVYTWYIHSICFLPWFLAIIVYTRYINSIYYLYTFFEFSYALTLIIQGFVGKYTLNFTKIIDFQTVPWNFRMVF